VITDPGQSRLSVYSNEIKSWHLAYKIATKISENTMKASQSVTRAREMCKKRGRICKELMGNCKL